MRDTKLDEQVVRAKQAMEQWPAWMKHAAHFVGSDEAPLPDNAEDHSFDE